MMETLTSDPSLPESNSNLAEDAHDLPSMVSVLKEALDIPKLCQVTENVMMNDAVLPVPVKGPHLQLLTVPSSESLFTEVKDNTLSDGLSEAKTQEDKHCCNCNSSLHSSVTTAKGLDDVITCEIFHAVSGESVFGEIKIHEILKILCSATYMIDEALALSSSNNLLLCFECINVLVKLYELYNEFFTISLRNRAVLAKIMNDKLKVLQKEFNTVTLEKSDIPATALNKNKTKMTHATKQKLSNKGQNEVEQSLCVYKGNRATSVKNSDPVKIIKRKALPSLPKNKPQLKVAFNKKVKRLTNKNFQNHVLSKERGNSVSVTKITDTGVSNKVESTQSFKTPVDNADKGLESSSDTCSRCGKRFKTFGGLKIHYASHVREDNKIACKECGKKFKKIEALEMHERIDHKGYKPHKCPYDGCERSFRLKDKLKLHIKVIHEKNKPFPCPKCEKAFRTRYHLKAHDVAQHIQGDPTIGCTQCRRKFPSRDALEFHIKTHEEEKRYVCSVCQKGFKTSSRLKLHSKSHDVLPSAVCATCGKAYKHIRDLLLHEVIHEGESSYRFACGDCPRKFYRIDLLRVHQSNEKHFSQEVVGPCVSKISDSVPKISKTKLKHQNSLDDCNDAELNESKSVTAEKPKRKRKNTQKTKTEQNSNSKNNEPLYDYLGSPTLFPTMVPIENVEDASNSLEIVELTPAVSTTSTMTSSLYKRNVQDLSEQTSFILSAKDPIIGNLVTAQNAGFSTSVSQASNFSLPSQTVGNINTIYAIKDTSERSISSFSITAGAEQIGYDVINAFINNLN